MNMQNGQAMQAPASRVASPGKGRTAACGRNQSKMPTSSREKPKTMLAWLGRLAEEARLEGRQRRAEIWRTTSNSFSRFLGGKDIQDLRGIGYFTALESLDCSDNALTSLDLSANTALQTLNASGNRLDIELDESNAFDVSSLPGFNMAKASDWTGCTRMGNKLTFTQQEVTYAYATGYSGSAEDASLKSVTFSLFADRDPSMGNETSDLQPQGRVYAKDRTLYTEGISGEVSVFTAVGTLVYQGKDTRIPVHQAGTYIVRHGEQVWKILVM